MGKFKDVGSPAAALAEECAEVIQVITKLQRFSGDWEMQVESVRRLPRRQLANC